MKNSIPTIVPELIGAAQIARNAVEEHGATIPLSADAADNLGQEADALTTARNNHEAGKVALANVRAALASVLLTVRLFLIFGRDSMKQVFGSRYSTAYSILGFSHNLSIPRSVEQMLSMLQSYKAFYIANPQYENAQNNLTAVRAQALYDQLMAARGDENTAQSQVQTMLATRDSAATTVRKRLRVIITELNLRLSPLDPRWTAFGFNKPGAKQVPGIPEGLSAMLIGNNAIALKWTNAPRAEYYRVYAKINGVDQELIAIGSPADLDFTIEGLPAATKVEVAISAVNNGGESQRSEIVAVTTA